MSVKRFYTIIDFYFAGTVDFIFFYDILYLYSIFVVRPAGCDHCQRAIDPILYFTKGEYTQMKKTVMQKYARLLARKGLGIR